jgi:hypothetical protein
MMASWMQTTCWLWNLLRANPQSDGTDVDRDRTITLRDVLLWEKIFVNRQLGRTDLAGS